MKKIYLFSLSVVMLSACNSGKAKNGSAEAGWPDVERQAFMDNCSSKAEASMGAERAKTYCSCMLDKVEKKYPLALDALKLSETEVTQMARECLPK